MPSSSSSRAEAGLRRSSPVIGDSWVSSEGGNGFPASYRYSWRSKGLWRRRGSPAVSSKGDGGCGSNGGLRWGNGFAGSEWFNQRGEWRRTNPSGLEFQPGRRRPDFDRR
ncbi:hypothetical protein D1007_58167 [Hordeum vulgare]|nr:hypothetical protein D1007_58167 [Hordeum vulgare]